MIFHDVAMSKVVECGEWLGFYDQLNARITSNFEYEVGGYIPYTLVNFHRYFAGSVRQKIEYPRRDYEVTDGFYAALALWIVRMMVGLETNHDVHVHSPL